MIDTYIYIYIYIYSKKLPKKRCEKGSILKEKKRVMLGAHFLANRTYLATTASTISEGFPPWNFLNGLYKCCLEEKPTSLAKASMV